MKVDLIDLKKQYSNIKNEVDSAIKTVLENSSFILGPEVEKFEKEFAVYCGSNYSVGVSSGTDVIFFSLKILGIGAGDEVIIPANTFIATALAVSYSGAKPVLVDCNEDYLIDPSQIEKAITPRTKAIIPVHLYGQVADMEEISKIALKHDLYVIEDACQAHGAEYAKRKAGSFGDIGCFSFHPWKNLGAYGDGGAITINNKEFYEKAILIRNIGQKKISP